MEDELVVVDSAGHTMIDIEAARAADHMRSAAEEGTEDDEGPGS